MKDENEITCLFELLGDIKEELLSEKYHLYDAPDFEIIAEIEISDMINRNANGVE